MNIAISGIGLATAQGGSNDILTGTVFHSPKALPWKANAWNVSRSCYPARDIDPSLTGPERWHALASRAFADLGEVPASAPLLIGSCNGDASLNWEQAFDTSVLLSGTRWANEPVFSSSCASGIHALYAAVQLLKSGAVDDALVLAADIISISNHENFESLRVLAETVAIPWQSTSSGFILGEAAVVLRLGRVKEQSEFALLSGPQLGSDLDEHDGLLSVLGDLDCSRVSLILGQGTGPFRNDNSELAAFSRFFERNVPVATPLSNFGHTLGASGLLAVALGALSRETAFLGSSEGVTMDGRPLVNSWGGHGGPPLQKVAACRALNGACAATAIGWKAFGRTERRVKDWRDVGKVGPLMNQTLRRLASEAIEHKPTEPPDVLILRMERPLAPPSSAIIGGRLLPSAVLEMTPGFASQLIARCWGFTGPALCLVGDPDAEIYGLRNVLHESGFKVFQVKLRGSGDDRAIEWNS